MVMYTSLGRVVSIFFLCFFLIGFVNDGNPLMYMVAFFCLAIILLASLVAWLTMRGVTFERDVPGSTVFSGDPLESKLVLREAHGEWRQLEVFDESTNMVTDQVTRRRMTTMMDGRRSRFAYVAGARQSSQRHGAVRVTEMPDVIRFARRGHYRLGPLSIHCYDPFGLVYVKKNFPETKEVIVYPHPLPIQEMVLGGASGRQSAEVRAGHVGRTPTSTASAPTYRATTCAGCIGNRRRIPVNWRSRSMSIVLPARSRWWWICNRASISGVMNSPRWKWRLPPRRRC